MAELAGLQRLAEEEREDDGHHQDEDEAAPIPQDLADLLPRHVADHPERAHRPRSASGAVRVRDMNTSSSVGATGRIPRTTMS